MVKDLKVATEVDVTDLQVQRDSASFVSTNRQIVYDTITLISRIINRSRHWLVSTHGSQ